MSKVYHNEEMILQNATELGRITTEANEMPSLKKIQDICSNKNIAFEQVQTYRISTTEWITVTEMPKDKWKKYKSEALLP